MFVQQHDVVRRVGSACNCEVAVGRQNKLVKLRSKKFSLVCTLESTLLRDATCKVGVDLVIQVSLQSHWFGVFQADFVLEEHSSI